MAARCREILPNRLVNNFGQKSAALTEAGCGENKLRKVEIFTAIWNSYKTLVDTNSTTVTAARCRENWSN